MCSYMYGILLRVASFDPFIRPICCSPTHFGGFSSSSRASRPARHPGRVTNKPLGSQWLSTHLCHLVRLATWHKLVSRHTSTCAATPRRCKRSEGMRSPRLRLSALSAGVRSRPYSRMRTLHMMAAVNRMPRTHTRASQRVDGCARLAVLSKELGVSLDGQVCYSRRSRVRGCRILVQPT